MLGKACFLPVPKQCFMLVFNCVGSSKQHEIINSVDSLVAYFQPSFE